jgi:hypothetical protein
MEKPPVENSPDVVVSPPAEIRFVPGAAVRSELKHLGSRSLHDSEHLKRFLRYIVEHTLAGEGDLLKEYQAGRGGI